VTAAGVPVKKLPAALASVLFAALFAPEAVLAEPYLAVRTGYKCMVCHVNPTGGGKRTEFGASYGQTALPASRLDLETGEAVPDGAPDPAPFTGKVNNHVGLGADLRANARATFTPNTTPSQAYAFDPVSAQVYLEVKPIVDRLTIYLDERVSPGAATNRETYAMLWTKSHEWYVKAGRMFVPFGLRIEDDTAFIRTATATTFNSFDDGVEGGMEIGPWSAYVSVTNGAAGGVETNRGKEISSLVTFVQSAWRVGLSANKNFNGDADREMVSAFAGLRTGIVSWLASVVRVTDEGTPTGRVSQVATLLEGNVEVAKGHNLKVTYEYLDPNTDVKEDQRERYSAVYEYTPIQFTQFRLGVRKGNGIPQNNAQNATEVFLQWHAFF
jgi:hypothetical protein